MALSIWQTRCAGAVGTLKHLVEPLHVGDSCRSLRDTSTGDASLAMVDCAKSDAGADPVQLDELRGAS